MKPTLLSNSSSTTHSTANSQYDDQVVPIPSYEQAKALCLYYIAAYKEHCLAKRASNGQGFIVILPARLLRKMDIAQGFVVE